MKNMAERREMEEKRNIEAEIKMIFGSAEPLDWLKEYQQKILLHRPVLGLPYPYHP